MKIDFVKTLEASSPYIPGRIYFEESTSLIKVATANNQYRVFGGVRSAEYDSSTQMLTIQNGNGDEVYLDMSVYSKISPGILKTNNSISYTPSTSESLSGTINLHKISKTGNYNDLFNAPAKVFTYNVTSISSPTKTELNGAYASIANALKEGKSPILILTEGTEEDDDSIIYHAGYYYIEDEDPDYNNIILFSVTYDENISILELDGSGNISIHVRDISAWEKGNVNNSLIIRNGTNTAESEYSISSGFHCSAGGNHNDIKSITEYLWSDGAAHAEGFYTCADGNGAHSEGSRTLAKEDNSHAEGIGTIARNNSEHAEGSFNLSTRTSSTYGNAGNTQHSVGIGTDASTRKNALEIMQNGDLYIIGVGSYNGTNYSSASTLQTILGNIPTQTTDASVSGWGYLKANDVSTKVDKTDAIKSLSLDMNSSTYVLTLSGTMADGSTFTVGNPVDLPLETMVVDGSYNSTTKQIVLGLKSGSTIEFSVADLVSGLQTEITSSNKLSADLIQDGTTNKVVTATDKNKWNNLVSNVQADWNATSGLAAILNKPTIPSTLDQIADGSTRKLSNYFPNSGGYLDNNAYIGVEDNTGDFSSNLNSSGLTVLNYQNGNYSKIVGNGLTVSNSSEFSGNYYTNYGCREIFNKDNSGNIRVLTLPTSTGTLALTSDIPTDASVAGWGYIKTITDASIAALGYTKNTGTLTGVKFNNVAATINGTVAEITATIPAAVTESTVSGWGFTKNAGTITGITMNGASKGTSGNVDLGTVITAETQPDWNVTNTSSAAYIKNKPTIPAAVTESTVSGWGFTKNAAANNATITIQKNGTTVDSFTVDASSNKTINMQVNELPAVTASDNGKILRVVNGAWTADTVVTVYSGSSEPSSSQGINGDIYIQS